MDPLHRVGAEVDLTRHPGGQGVRLPQQAPVGVEEQGRIRHGVEDRFGPLQILAVLHHHQLAVGRRGHAQLDPSVRAGQVGHHRGGLARGQRRRQRVTARLFDEVADRGADQRVERSIEQAQGRRVGGTHLPALDDQCGEGELSQLEGFFGHRRESFPRLPWAGRLALPA